MPQRSMTCLGVGEAAALEGATVPPAPAAAGDCDEFPSRSVLMPEAPVVGLEEVGESAGIAAGM